MGVLLLRQAKMSSKFLLVLALAVNILVGAFTISRTWILLTIVGVSLAFLFGYRGAQRIALFASFGIILILLVIVLLETSDIQQAFSNRFDTVSEDTRMSLLGEYMDFLWKNPLRLIFGTGALYYKEISGCSNSLHCGSQQILVSYGIMGVLFWLWLMISPIRRYLLNHKFEFRAILPVLIVVVYTQTIQFINPYMLVMPYMVAVCFMKTLKSGEEV